MSEPLTHANLRRLRRYARLTRHLAALVVTVCVLLALVLAHGGWVAAQLGQWGTLAMAAAGVALLGAVAAFTVVLVRRQKAILETGETLLGLGGGQDPQ